VSGVPAARDGEDGFTLVELMVAIVLSGIVLGVLASTLIQAQRNVAGTFQRQDDLGQARVAVAAVSADLRALTTLQGVILETATDDTVTFYADRDTPCLPGSPGPPVTPPACEGPVRITITRTPGGELVRDTVRPPTGSGRTPLLEDYEPPPAPPDEREVRSRVLARGLRTDEPVFRYHATFGYAGSPTPTPAPSNLPTTGTPPALPAASVPLVRFVEVTLAVDPPDFRGVEPTRVRAVVRLPNLAPR